jgi:hypothetical protein
LRLIFLKRDIKFAILQVALNLQRFVLSQLAMRTYPITLAK